MEATWVFQQEKDLCDYLASHHNLSPAEDRERRAALIPRALALSQRDLGLPRHVTYHAALLLHRLMLVFPPGGLTDVELLGVAVLIASKAEECPRKAAAIAECLADAALTKKRLLEIEPTAMTKTGFDFTIDTPLRHILRLTREVVVLPASEEEKAGQVTEMALKLLERALATPACLLFGVRVIAAACVVRATEVVGVQMAGSFEESVWRCDSGAIGTCSEYLHSPFCNVTVGQSGPSD